MDKCKDKPADTPNECYFCHEKDYGYEARRFTRIKYYSVSDEKFYIWWSCPSCTADKVERAILTMERKRNFWKD